MIFYIKTQLGLRFVQRFIKFSYFGTYFAETLICLFYRNCLNKTSLSVFAGFIVIYEQDFSYKTEDNKRTFSIGFKAFLGSLQTIGGYLPVFITPSGGPFIGRTTAVGNFEDPTGVRDPTGDKDAGNTAGDGDPDLDTGDLDLDLEDAGNPDLDGEILEAIEDNEESFFGTTGGAGKPETADDTDALVLSDPVLDAEESPRLRVPNNPSKSG